MTSLPDRSLHGMRSLVLTVCLLFLFLHAGSGPHDHFSATSSSSPHFHFSSEHGTFSWAPDADFPVRDSITLEEEEDSEDDRPDEKNYTAALLRPLYRVPPKRLADSRLAVSSSTLPISLSLLVALRC